MATPVKRKKRSTAKRVFKPLVEFWEKPYSQKDPIEKIGTMVILGAGLFILWKNGKKIYQTFQDYLDQKELSEELDKLSGAGINPTYIESQYKIFADGIWTALDSTWYNPLTWGTREENIRGIMSQMNNEADVIKLISAFGMREGLTLAESFHDDMSDAYIQEYVNEPLQAKGIKISF